jgi:hypothetical protein
MSINGLSMHVLGISVVGPAYHGVCSLLLIGVALISDNVAKSWATIILLFGVFSLIVAAQLVAGFSYPSDIGILYKWFMPLLLFGVYYRWSYLRTREGRVAMVSVFQRIPLWYSGLIVLSLVVYLLTGFEATVFEESVGRFTGFSWGYNYTVNALLICAYFNYLVEGTSFPRTVFYGFGFFNLRSKTAFAYFAVAAVGLAKRLWHGNKQFGALRGVMVVPCLALVLAFGIRESLRSAAIYGGELGVSLSRRYGEEVATRGAWAVFAIQDVPTWPIANLLIGNGVEIDRRVLNPLWATSIGVAKYRRSDLDRQNKAIELDFLGPLDMLGVCGMVCFVAVFYIYPFAVTRMRGFRPYYAFIVALSLLAGHVINNPEVTPLLVFFILLARDYGSAAQNRTSGLEGR